MTGFPFFHVHYSLKRFVKPNLPNLVAKIFQSMQPTKKNLLKIATHQIWAHNLVHARRVDSSTLVQFRAQCSACEAYRFLYIGEQPSFGLCRSQHRHLPSSPTNFCFICCNKLKTLLVGSSGVSLWVGWVRSDLITEMRPGLLTSDRLFSSRVLVQQYRHWQRSSLGLWLQKVHHRLSWRPRYHLYRSLGIQKGSRLDGWSDCWPLSHNPESKNTTGGSETGSTMWGHRTLELPRARGGLHTFGAGPPYRPWQIRKYLWP